MCWRCGWVCVLHIPYNTENQHLHFNLTINFVSYAWTGTSFIIADSKDVFLETSERENTNKMLCQHFYLIGMLQMTTLMTTQLCHLTTYPSATKNRQKKFTLKIKETQFHLFYNLKLTKPSVSADNAHFLVCFIFFCLCAGDVDVDYPNTVQIKLVFR